MTPSRHIAASESALRTRASLPIERRRGVAETVITAWLDSIGLTAEWAYEAGDPELAEAIRAVQP